MKLKFLLIVSLLIHVSILSSCGGGESDDIIESGSSGEEKQDQQENQSQPEKATSGITDGHEWVDLGLPSGTLWAKTNVGADTETDAGLYFAWGETTGYTSDTSDGRSFEWEHLKYCSGTTYEGPFTKYILVDGKTELESSDDAATTNWGSNWQMPSKAQQDELRTECTWTWDSTNKGCKVAGTNGNSIFLPAAGFRGNSNLSNAGYGYYWSRSLQLYNISMAYYINFGKSSFSNYDYFWRNRGLNVRAVRVQKTNNTLTR